MRARASPGSKLSHSVPIISAKSVGRMSGSAIGGTIVPGRAEILGRMRFLVWTGVEEWLTETAAVELAPAGLRAVGTQLGADPVPYRVDYRLEAPERYVTSELELTASAEGWRRHLLLRHDGSGGWRADGAP